MYALLITPRARRALQRTPDPHRRRLLVAIERLAEEPRPPGCRRLAGTDSDWRIRVGAWRVLYTIVDRELTVTVVRVAQRKDAYRR